MGEIPLVIYEAQRAGPSTGVPTYTAQSDLLFTLFAGHGDFPRILIAPAHAEEAYRATREALNLAWEFQVPVIVLGDRHLGESYYTVSLERKRLIRKPRMWDGRGEFKIQRNGRRNIPLSLPRHSGGGCQGDKLRTR